MALQVIDVAVGGKLLSDVDALSDEIEATLTGALKELAPALRSTTHEFLRDVYDRLEKAHGQPWSPSPRADNLYSRSGQGLRDILNSIKVTGTPDDLVGNLKLSGYMAVQQTGATIKAKRSKYLTIPLPAALNGRGIPLRRRARDWDDTFVARSKRGNLLIFQRKGRGVTPLYLLRQSVTLKPRLHMDETIQDALPFFERRVFEQISRHLGA